MNLSTFNFRHSTKKGFTLIELLVVIAIISILIAVGVTSYQKATKLSRDAKRKTDLEQIRQALETYRSENNTYPTTASWQTDLTSGYINSIPVDPKGYTYYYARGTTTTYQLCAKLEVAPASNSCSGSRSCGTGGTCDYGTANP